MALKIRRGTEAQRASVQFALGELVWTTDTYRLYVGDGIEQGGHNIAKNLAGTGMAFNATTNRLDVNYNGLGSDLVAEGANNLYFTQERAQDAVGTALVAGNLYNNGITFSYDDVNGRITAVVSVAGGDTLPDDTGHANEFLKTDGVGGYSWAAVNTLPDDTGQTNKFLTTNGLGVYSWATPVDTGLTSVSEDPTPTLGGDLTLNSNDITGTGNININGFVGTTSIKTTSLYLDIGHENPTLSSIVRRSLPEAGSHTLVESLTSGTWGTGLDAKIYRGTPASKLIVQAGDVLMTDSVAGWNGTDYQYTSAVVHSIDPYATVSGSSVPGSVGLVVWNSNNPADLTRSLFLDSRGYVSIGSMAQPQATLDVNGFARLAILSAAPASPTNGMIAIADGTTWDPAGTGKSVMVVYLGGGWRVAATAP